MTMWIARDPSEMVTMTEIHQHFNIWKTNNGYRNRRMTMKALKEKVRG